MITRADEALEQAARLNEAELPLQTAVAVDVTKQVSDDVLELILRHLPMAALFRAGRVSRRWRVLVGRVSQMWPAIDVQFAKYAVGALDPQIFVRSADGFDGLQGPKRMERGHDSVNVLAASVDGRRLYSGSVCGVVSVWSAVDGVPLQTPHSRTDTQHQPGGMPAGSVYALALSADGQRLYSGSRDISVWSTAEGARLLTLQGHTCTVYALAVSADGERLYSGSYDCTVRVWSTAGGAPLLTLRSHTGPVHALALSLDGQRLYSGSEDCTVRAYSTVDGRVLQLLEGHRAPVYALALSADGLRLYSGSADCTVRACSTVDGALLQVLEGHKGPVQALALSADDRQLYSGSDDCTVCVWAAMGSARRPLQTLQGHMSAVFALAFSADGRWLYSGHENGTVLKW
jgi:WD40 repeat protein